MNLRAHGALELLIQQAEAPYPTQPVKGKFVPKHNIQKLSDYTVPPDESFWENFPSVSWEEAANIKGKIDYDLLWELGEQLDYPDLNSLKAACRDLEEGARLGVSPDHHMASTSTNALSALEHGEMVTDALAGWLESKFAMGPFSPEEVPFKMFRLSGLMTKGKPDGSVRIIVNLSKGNPCAVNDGIDKKDYETIMSSTEAWVRVMWRCGVDCRFCKMDWRSAYKVALKLFLFCLFVCF